MNKSNIFMQTGLFTFAMLFITCTSNPMQRIKKLPMQGLTQGMVLIPDNSLHTTSSSNDKNSYKKEVELLKEAAELETEIKKVTRKARIYNCLSALSTAQLWLTLPRVVTEEFTLTEVFLVNPTSPENLAFLSIAFFGSPYFAKTAGKLQAGTLSTLKGMLKDVDNELIELRESRKEEPITSNKN